MWLLRLSQNFHYCAHEEILPPHFIFSIAEYSLFYSYFIANYTFFSRFLSFCCWFNQDSRPTGTIPLAGNNIIRHQDDPKQPNSFKFEIVGEFIIAWHWKYCMPFLLIFAIGRNVHIAKCSYLWKNWGKRKKRSWEKYNWGEDQVAEVELDISEKITRTLQLYISVQFK